MLRTNSNATIYNSTCTASNPAVIPVDLHSTRWYLEIGYKEECMTWVIPAAVVFSLGVAGLLMLALYSTHQSLRNSLLVQLRHESEIRHLRDRQEQAAREEATAGSDAIRWLVTRFCQAVSASSKQMGSVLETSISATGPMARFLRPDSFISSSSGSSGCRVVARIWKLSIIQATDPDACRWVVQEFNFSQQQTSTMTGSGFIGFNRVSPGHGH